MVTKLDSVTLVSLFSVSHHFSILYNLHGKVGLFDLFFGLCYPKKRENVNSFAAFATRMLCGHMKDLHS